MIDTNEQLSELLPRLQNAGWIALDTEANSLHAYPEKLCLIQVSITGEDILIDPLAPIDLDILWPELKKHELIFHAADYDLRLFRRKHSFVPNRIFDTMLAARLLGEKQFGLNHLVAKFLDVHLEKGSQTADWGQRPLTARMEAYARNDTHFLKPLADILRQKLEEKGRLRWHQESCARLIQDCAELPPPDLEPWRIKGNFKLSRLGLAILRELWGWREREAVAANKPPYFVLAHELLIEIAEVIGRGEQIDRLLPRHLSPRRRRELEAAIKKGLGLSPEEHPHLHFASTPRPTNEEKRRFEELRKIRDRAASQFEIDPTLIASRGTLGLLAQDWAHHERELMPWQRELLQKHV